jgi:hypothetical protein
VTRKRKPYWIKLLPFAVLDTTSAPMRKLSELRLPSAAGDVARSAAFLI